MQPSVKPESADVDNAEFWNELCGSHAANALGISDTSRESLRKYDEWLFDYYPYLFEHVILADLKDRDLLDVGLGYGSLSKRIVESGARYTGIDVAAGPVAMLRHRLKQTGLMGHVFRASILAAPFPDESFDRINAIGSLQHTGDMAKAIAQCCRLLRPGGSLTFMGYYAYSYRRWMQAPRQTLNYLLSELGGYRGVVKPHQAVEKADFDQNSVGEAAPHTDFISAKSLRALCSGFSVFTWKLRNINQEPPFSKRTRDQLLRTRWPGICGLDIYATAIK